MAKVFCPYCGSSNTHRTAFGWGESIVKDTATFAIGMPLSIAASFIPFVGHGAAHSISHKFEKIEKSNSCEYQCDCCHKTFGYSSGKGSIKR